VQDLRLLHVARTGVSANPDAATRAVYERWAPLYPPMAHNPLMRAEQAAMLRHWPDVTGRLALDLACGSGRYSRILEEKGVAEVVALDFCPPMLAQVTSAKRVCASMMQLPFAAEAFDVVISGLALSHASSVAAWMLEVARVLRPGGALLYSDYHPQAAREGLPRSFKDRDERTWTVPHQSFDLISQQAAATAANFTLEVVHEIRVGMELNEAFPKSDAFYRQWQGLPIALIVRARK
jgi:ubiquinone/menaquinone biosynthesis C-methylase UbiE